MKLNSVIESVRRNVTNHGAVSATYDVALRSINTCFYLKNLTCVAIENSNPQYWTLPAGLEFCRFTESILMPFTREPRYELPLSFVEKALEKGDECYGILDGQTLAAYGWYSTNPTPVEKDLNFHFDNRYVYMYKGFTPKEYRGKRLHAIGMTRALDEYLHRGFKGLVSYVEANNFDSLKSCYRMGYRFCGNLYVLRVAGRYIVVPGRNSKSCGFDLRPAYAHCPSGG